MKKIKLIVGILLILVIGLLVFLKKTEIFSQTDFNGLKVVFLDIGQGDATFIEFPNHEQMLIDCAIDSRILEALGKFMPYYDKTLDYLVITHPDLDHYGGCIDVLKRFKINKVIYNGLRKDYDPQWQVFWQLAHEEGEYIEIDDFQKWLIGNVNLYFLYPDHSLVKDKNIPNYEFETDTNNTSIVIKLEYNQQSVLLTGDMEILLENYLLAKYPSEFLKSQFLKIGHHGSPGASGQDFLNTVKPNHAIISCGLNNKYHHPSARVLNKLKRVQAKIWRTDYQGDICLFIQPDFLPKIETCF